MGKIIYSNTSVQVPNVSQEFLNTEILKAACSAGIITDAAEWDVRWRRKSATRFDLEKKNRGVNDTVIYLEYEEQ